MGDVILSELPPDYLEIRLTFGDPSEQPDVRLLEIHVIGRDWAARNPAVRDAVAPWVGVD